MPTLLLFCGSESVRAKMGKNIAIMHIILQKVLQNVAICSNI